ncbi:hypothetical protein F4692_003272 [Nocardioides cavernae]|uniref:Uncharacterized protein n=1 Tax=Nocardioides cavernae TaxID=1921566 RepID=A0A7Y9KU08_9ACTN|nr:hypothetical protein [Nocardioides cavernae]NYE38127.1 hypothetical protein [Nocardioides cavernae]
MRTRAHAQEPTTTAQHRPLAWAVLTTAVLQVVAPAVTINGPGSSPGDGAGAELLITPVGWAFSIWGVVYTLAIVQALSALLSSDVRVSRRFQVDQVVLYSAAVLWIFMAALDSSTLTFLALAVMFVAALDGVLTLARTTVEPRRHRIISRTAFGLFAGWVSAAFFLNLSTALVGWGLVDADAVAWQLVVVAVATATLVGFVLTTRLPAYAAAGLWALAGIVVTGVDDGTLAVVVAGAVAAAVLATATAVALRRSAVQPG